MDKVPFKIYIDDATFILPLSHHNPAAGRVCFYLALPHLPVSSILRGRERAGSIKTHLKHEFMTEYHNLSRLL